MYGFRPLYPFTWNRWLLCMTTMWRGGSASSAYETSSSRPGLGMRCIEKALKYMLMSSGMCLAMSGGSACLSIKSLNSSTAAVTLAANRRKSASEANVCLGKRAAGLECTGRGVRTSRYAVFSHHSSSQLSRRLYR